MKNRPEKTSRRHPVHPALVHFPLAFLLAFPCLQGWFLLAGSAFYRDTALLALQGGLLLSLPAIAAGGHDFYKNVIRPQKKAVFDTALWHIMAAVTALLLDGGALVFCVRQGGLPDSNGWISFSLGGSAAALLLVTGWLGGKMVYTHGTGVRLRTPENSTGAEKG